MRDICAAAGTAQIAAAMNAAAKTEAARLNMMKSSRKTRIGGRPISAAPPELVNAARPQSAGNPRTAHDAAKEEAAIVAALGLRDAAR
jgi:hypothetical protein